MHIDTATTVRDLAIQIPGATRVFERMKVDYCCGGQQTLADACARAQVNTDEIQRMLEEAAGQSTAASTGNEDLANASLAHLVDHIVRTHHAYTKTELDRLEMLAEKVFQAHGANHLELLHMRALVQELAAELRPHMMKEEQVLFPYIVILEESAARGLQAQAPPFGTVRNPVRKMMTEHDAAGTLLEQMREVSANYAIPEDACFSYRTLYGALEELERDLHQHIHLENNILFPRAIELESASVLG